MPCLARRAPDRRVPLRFARASALCDAGQRLGFPTVSELFSRHMATVAPWSDANARVHALRGVYTCMCLRLFDWASMSDAYVAMCILGHSGLTESLVYTPLRSETSLRPRPHSDLDISRNPRSHLSRFLRRLRRRHRRWRLLHRLRVRVHEAIRFGPHVRRSEMIRSPWTWMVFIVCLRTAVGTVSFSFVNDCWMRRLPVSDVVMRSDSNFGRATVYRGFDPLR